MVFVACYVGLATTSTMVFELQKHAKLFFPLQVACAFAKDDKIEEGKGGLFFEMGETSMTTCGVLLL